MKWYGNIAFSNQVETEPDVFEEKLIKKKFMGDFISVRKSNDMSTSINVDLSVSNQLSVLIDPFLQNNFHNIVYVEFNGSKWTVSSVELKERRLLLSFGKLYKEDGHDE